MTTIQEIQKELCIQNKDIAEFFGYKDVGSYNRATRKPHIVNGVEQIYKLIKHHEST